MRVIVAGLIFAFGNFGISFAQETDQLCHHAGLTYSPGSIVSMGQTLQRCALTDSGLNVWSPIASEDGGEVFSANCISGGREFGHGSILPAGQWDLTCHRGTWFIKKD